MPVYEEKEKVNGQKRYYIRTYITDEFGKKKQVTRHSKNWVGRDGYWLAYQEESQLKNKKYNEYENMTLKELYDNYINYCVSIQKLKRSTIIKKQDDYRLYVEPYFTNNKILSDITNKDVLNWHEWLIKNKKLSFRFNKDIHTFLVTMLNYACKFHNLEKNVASICGNFSQPKGIKKKEMNFLTLKEFKKYIERENNEIYECFFTILFFTGMRLGELWCLKWGDVNFETKEININKSYNPKNKEETVPKTSKSNRTIKILNIVEEKIKQMLKYKTDDYIFGTTKITGTTLRRKNKNNYEFIKKDKKFRIHDFRHSFASMCIAKNVPISIISEYLGHENISTTLDIYSHLYPNSQDKLIEILDNKGTTMKKQKEEFIDYVMDIVNKSLLNGKTKEEISSILENINKEYLPKQDQKQD